MIDFFENKIDTSEIICHSGGALGADTYFQEFGNLWGIKTRAYSYKTSYHKSDSKVEISQDDFIEGIEKVNLANKTLKRTGLNKYLNLLSRNWAQVKYSRQTFAIGSIVNPGQKSKSGYLSKSKIQTVDGGTGYAVQMSIDHQREIFVFDQNLESWFIWSYITDSFVKTDSKIRITNQNFAGIGTRKINDSGISAIKKLYENTFKL